MRAVGNSRTKAQAGPNGSKSNHGLATRGGQRTVASPRRTPTCSPVATATKMSMVLNGIVENYRELRDGLIAEGHTFSLETDAETVSHLIERHYDGDLRRRPADVRGARGSLHFRRHPPRPPRHAGRGAAPDAARGGIGSGEMFLAFNAAAFLKETRQVQFPNDGDIVTITPRARSSPASTARSSTTRSSSTGTTRAPRKGGYEMFMPEIYEQSEAVAETIGDRVRHGTLVLEGLGMSEQELS